MHLIVTLNWQSISFFIQMCSRALRLGLRTSSVWSYTRSNEWWLNIALKYTDEQWLQDFRLSKETFRFICTEVKPALEREDTSFRQCIPLQKRVAITLFKLASTAEYRLIANLFGVSTTSVCRCVQEFCGAVISRLLPKLIKSPSSGQLQQMANFFEERWGVPQCVGAIDGSHIPIIRPSQFQADYHNRKGWHSIILQAVVDGKGRFWDLCVGSPGSIHDARVLRLSSFFTLASNGTFFPGTTRNICGENVGYYIIGDSAYPLQSWLLKPFADNGRLTASQELYNQRTSRARAVVEHAFGRLKGRWRCLLKRNDSSIELVKDMILTCCVLHNLCEKNREPFMHEWNAPPDQPMSATAPRDDIEGSNVRNALLQFFSVDD